VLYFILTIVPKRKASPNRRRQKPVYIPRPQRQEGNELQRRLFVEIHDSLGQGAGRELVDSPGVFQGWLKTAKSHLIYLARLGEGVATQTTLLGQTLQLGGEMQQTPSEVLDWIEQWACLRDLVGPKALKGLSFEARRERFLQLSTLNENL
jgi:hypothetical protein